MWGSSSWPLTRHRVQKDRAGGARDRHACGGGRSGDVLLLRAQLGWAQVPSAHDHREKHLQSGKRWPSPSLPGRPAPQGRRGWHALHCSSAGACPAGMGENHGLELVPSSCKSTSHIYMQAAPRYPGWKPHLRPVAKGRSGPLVVAEAVLRVQASVERAAGKHLHRALQAG